MNQFIQKISLLENRQINLFHEVTNKSESLIRTEYYRLFTADLSIEKMFQAVKNYYDLTLPTQQLEKYHLENIQTFHNYYIGTLSKGYLIRSSNSAQEDISTDKISWSLPFINAKNIDDALWTYLGDNYFAGRYGQWITLFEIIKPIRVVISNRNKWVYGAEIFDDYLFFYQDEDKNISNKINSKMLSLGIDMIIYQDEIIMSSQSLLKLKFRRYKIRDDLLIPQVDTRGDKYSMAYQEYLAGKLPIRFSLDYQKIFDQVEVIGSLQDVIFKYSICEYSHLVN